MRECQSPLFFVCFCLFVFVCFCLNKKNVLLSPSHKQKGLFFRLSPFCFVFLLFVQKHTIRCKKFDGFLYLTFSFVFWNLFSFSKCRFFIENKNEETTPLLLLLFLFFLLPPSLSTQQTNSCVDCENCPGESTVYFSLHKEIESKECQEGERAAITKLRTSSSFGKYKIETRNPDSAFDKKPPFIYNEGTWKKIGVCFEAACEKLPIVGDQTKIVVDLDCETAKSCDFLFDIEFDCFRTGVLTSDEEGGVQVLTDIDDTIICPNPQCERLLDCPLSEVGHFLAGKDTRLKVGEFYPGVAEVILGLALGIPKKEGDEGVVPAKPRFFSARPREGGPFVKISQSSALNEYLESVGEDRGILIGGGIWMVRFMGQFLMVMILLRWGRRKRGIKIV